MRTTTLMTSGRLTALAIVCAGGCLAPPTTPMIWVEEAPVSAGDGQRPFEPQEAAARVQLFAAMNETVGFLFAIRTTSAVSQPVFRVSSEGPRAQDTDQIVVELFRAHEVPVGTFPGWHVRSIPPIERERNPLDAIVPIHAPGGGLPQRLEAETTYHFWADVLAPKGITAGLHAVRIVCEARGKTVGAVDVELTVWPVVLPDEADLFAIAQVDHLALFRHHFDGVPPRLSSTFDWRDQPDPARYDDLVRATLRLLQSHRVCPVLDDFGPPFKVSSRGEVEIDWSLYDTVAGPVLSGDAFDNRVPLPAWPLPVKSVLGMAGTERSLAPGSQEILKRYFAEIALHFREKGWFERSYAEVDGTEWVSPQSLKTTQRLARLMHESDRRISVASHAYPQDVGRCGWVDYPRVELSEEIDVWVPPAQFYDAQAMAGQRASGRRTWLAVDRAPFSGSLEVSAPPSHPLALSWQARSLSAQALWLGSANRWPIERAPATPAQCVQLHPGSLIYPGKPFGLKEPVPSLRLKRLRESMQAAAYARLLSQHGLGHVAAAMESALVKHAGAQSYRTHFADGRPVGWEGRADLYEQARRIMGERMVERAGGAGSEERVPAENIRWLAFMNQTHGVRVRGDGVRLRRTGTPAEPRLQLESWYTLSNETRVPYSGALALRGLEGRCAATESAHAVSLAAGQSARVVLAAECDPQALWSDPPNEFAAQLSVPDGPAIDHPARLSAVVAEPNTAPIAIDGDLSDWPPAAGNVVSDFRLIAGDCAGLEEADCARPGLRTFAFLRRDAANLYIAVNVEARPVQTALETRRRSVVYDDLIPMDEEDLVEILIDPLNGGTRTPADLFHIVVKRSGMYLAERGISTVPPVAPRRAWTADLDIASTSAPNRWVAELRIPLSSLGMGEEVRGEIWGFNVTHYNAGDQEFSTWSGAVGNAYDPLSLGNLMLP